MAIHQTGISTTGPMVQHCCAALAASSRTAICRPIVASPFESSCTHEHCDLHACSTNGTWQQRRGSSRTPGRLLHMWRHHSRLPSIGDQGDTSRQGVIWRNMQLSRSVNRYNRSVA